MTTHVYLMSDIRVAKYSDEPRYWSYSDKDYERVRILKTHTINQYGAVVPIKAD